MFRQLPLTLRTFARARSTRPCFRHFSSHAAPRTNWSAVWRRSGLLAAVSATGASIFLLQKRDKILLDAKPPAASELAKSGTEAVRKDPATGIEFPEALVIPSRVRLPPFQLVGLGVRTVSFVNLKVYSVAFYADLSNLKIPENLTPDEKIDFVISNTACVLRMIPTRNTSYSHLRDGFIRSVQSRLSSQLKSGEISTQEAEEAQSPIRKLKSMFPNTPLKKGRPLDILLLAPPKNPDEKRILIVRDLGSVENNWLAKEFVKIYFVGKGISPPVSLPALCDSNTVAKRSTVVIHSLTSDIVVQFSLDSVFYEKSCFVLSSFEFLTLPNMISNWRSIFALIVFLLTNLVGVFPLYMTIPLPASFASLTAKLAEILRLCIPSQTCCHLHPSLCKSDASTQHKRKIRWYRIAINFQTAPLVAVLLLLATRILDGHDVKEGIVGSDSSGIQPLDIMALFVSLAYLSISLDATGLFRFLAFWVVRKGGSSGRRLYLYLYIFFFISGIFVGNDPVVLFGTPFLAYFSRVSGIVPPTAWIFAQFATANMSSAVLPSSNLTNLVLTGAFSYSFISFAAHTILPTLSAATAVFPLLAFVLFTSTELVPREIDVVVLQHSVSESESASSRDMTSRHAPGDLTDKHGAIFGSILLGITLSVLIGTSPLEIPVWQVTVPPALIMLGRDIWHDRKMWTKGSEPESLEGGRLESNSPPDPIELQPFPKSGEMDAPQSDATERKDRSTLASYIQNIKRDTLPTVMGIIPRLPLSLVLFAFCMFILVQALTTWGWVEVFAGWWSAWIRVCTDNGTGSATVGAIGGMLLISTLLCNICGTNIGTTILLARVLQAWLDSSASSGTTVDPKVKLGSIFALALGTNFGAFTFSFSASLAGLLWQDTLRQKGIVVRQRQFAMLNLPIVGVAIVLATAVLVAEVYVTAR
ncbi:Chalcone-flavanone isomerase [Sanghuangporus baumii]|uniref:Chalcone-flavanone isomerase n=1 Tax=Sanghuangporus baumii TaxID=108892 RepID=A0A9Q5NBZ8_SANBA|nr:Chalcone-flavanone isomerase [Sanghuangporus baumii]